MAANFILESDTYIYCPTAHMLNIKLLGNSMVCLPAKDNHYFSHESLQNKLIGIKVFCHFLNLSRLLYRLPASIIHSLMLEIDHCKRSIVKFL